MIQRILLSILILLALTNVFSAHAYVFSEPNDDGIEICYNFLSSTRKTVEVTYDVISADKYSGVTAIKIPGTVTHNGVTYEVTEIGGNAFSRCKSLTSVTFPETIQKIGFNSFGSCNLTELELPASIEEISDNAFVNNPLTKINLQALTKLEELSSNAFKGCTQLTEVILPNSLRTIQSGAFRDCSNLQNIGFPPNLTTIGSWAFKGTAINSIRLPSSLKTIGISAFMDCENLTYVYIPETITEIGGGAFAGSTPDLNIQSNPRFKIYDGTLYDANRDTLICYFGRRGGEFIVPDGVKAVKVNAFSYNKNLTSIILPNSVEEAYGIVGGATKLEYLKLPDFVKNTTLSGFSANRALKEVVIPRNITELDYMCFYNCEALEKINLPEGLECIKNIALGNTNLKSIHIPSTVNKISHEAISAPLKIVYCDIDDIGNVTYEYAEPSDNDTFSVFGKDTDLSGATLVVPEGTVEEYKKLSTWNRFGVITDNTHTFSMDHDVILSTKKVTPVTVSMNNPADIIGFQADIVLPDGVTIPRNEEGELQINLTSRADKTHSVSAEMKGNVVKMVVISMKNAAFKEHEGPLFTFDVEVSGDMDESTIEINNIILSEHGSAERYLPPVWESYAIRNYTPGDTNDDGRVAVGDITCVADYVVGREVEHFSTAAADINGDGNVTVGDITMLIDLILNSVDQYAEQRGIRQINESGKIAEQPVEFFSFVPIEGEIGKDVMLNVNFTNVSPFIAFQADILLPKGVTIENDEYGDPDIQLSARAADHFVSARKVAENTYRMVVISMKNCQFNGNDGVLFSCPLKLDCPIGKYEIQLKKLIISLPGNTEVDCPDFKGQLMVSEKSSTIDAVIDTTGNPIYYNLQGIRVDRPSAGVYIRIRNGLSSTVLVK